MAMGYELTVKCNGTDEINISTFGDNGSGNINDVVFKKITLDKESSNKRSNSIRYEFKILGLIKTGDGGTKESTLELAKWALDESTTTLYRTIEITINEDSEAKANTKILRHYTFSNMYVIDYEEEISNDLNDESGTFTLHLGQKTEKSQRDINVT